MCFNACFIAQRDEASCQGLQGVGKQGAGRRVCLLVQSTLLWGHPWSIPLPGRQVTIVLVWPLLSAHTIEHLLPVPLEPEATQGQVSMLKQLASRCGVETHHE